MAIYRGNGGAGDATGGVTLNTITELTLDAENSATEAATSASNAATSATSAANSASAASTSATNSSNSATAAATSATNSANSATAAASSASAAASSASDAASSATDAQTAQTAAEAAESNASTSASAAASSASSASSSASTATTQATNAASSASAAATSATNAANSATTASGYVSDAADQVTLATTQATNAANSATAASSSASSAASSAAAAAASLDSFDDRYLGAKSSAPTLDNDGNALITGALYYDTTEGSMFVYDGGQWIAASSASQAILTVYKYTATSGQTTFSGADDNAATLGYTAGSIIVTLNGVFLEGGDDYTATDGSSVVLSAGATTSDEVNIYAFNTFDVANVQVIGDERYVRLSTDQTVAGTKTLSSNPVLSAGTANGVTYLNGSKVLTSGSGLAFDGTKLAVLSSSAATLGSFKSTSTSNQSVQLQVLNDNDTPLNIGVWGSSAGSFGILGASTPFMTTNASTLNFANTNASGSIVWGIGTSATESMRLTSTGLGIGTSSPANPTGGRGIEVSNSNGASLRLTNSATYLDFQSGGSANYILSNGAYPLLFYTNGSERLRLDSSGNLGLGVTPSASTFKNFQINTTGVIGSSAGYVWFGNNWVFNSGDKYIADGYATLYGSNEGKHEWFIAPSGTAGNAISFTRAMTLDSSGNLLVGATSATYSAAGRGLVEINGSSTSLLALKTGGSAAGYVYHDGTEMSVVNTRAGSLQLTTNGSERARIDSSGRLLVGTTSHGDGSMFQSSATSLNCYRTATAGAGVFGVYSDEGGTKTVRAYIKCDGGFANYSANDQNLSDERLKKDITLAGSYLAKICAIPVKTFRYKEQSDTDGLTIGVIAQDVQKIAPELVSNEGFGINVENDNDYLSIYQTDLQYALMKCIQEQQAIIDSLTARVSALEGN